MTVVKVGWCARRRLKSVAKKIFLRLIIDKESGHVNALQDGALIAAMLLVLAGFVSPAYFVALQTGILAYFDANKPLGVDGASAPPLVIAVAALVVAAPLLALRRSISALSYGVVGWVVITWRRLRPESTAARANIADMKYWLRSDPKRIREEVEAQYCKACKEVLPPEVAGALTRLADETSPDSFVTCRGLFERKYWWLYALGKWRTPRPGEARGGDKAGYYILARAIRNAIKMAICFEALDVEMRDEAANGERWWWDYFSRPDYQQVPLWDEYDLPLRFRTAAPHLRWQKPSDSSSDGEAPLFRAISGLENPMGFPVNLLRLRDVIAEMPAVAKAFFKECAPDTPAGERARLERSARALAVLATLPVKLIGRHDSKTLMPVMGRDATESPLLARLDSGSVNLNNYDADDLLAADWGVRWDPNRIAWSDFKPTDAELMQALAMFNDAINESMRRVAQKVVLHRGDVLFIDNRRCLVARFEHEMTRVVAMKRVVGLPAEWWLRRFYGFRKSRNADWAESGEEQRFSVAAPGGPAYSPPLSISESRAS